MKKKCQQKYINASFFLQSHRKIVNLQKLYCKNDLTTYKQYCDKCIMHYEKRSYRDLLQRVDGIRHKSTSEHKMGYCLKDIEQTSNLKTWFKVPTNYPYIFIPDNYVRYDEPILVIEDLLPPHFVYVEASPQQPIYVCEDRSKRYYVTKFIGKNVLTLEYLMNYMYHQIHGSTLVCLKSKHSISMGRRIGGWHSFFHCFFTELSYPVGYGSSDMYDGIKNMYLYDRVALSPGTILNSHYRVLNTLGEGSFGLTYLANDIHQNTYVVIKEFFMRQFSFRTSSGNIAYMEDADDIAVSNAMAKFLGESRKASAVSHPNIVKVLDSFRENKTAYYVMPYIKGIDLYELQQSQPNNKFPVVKALNFVIQIGHALIALHEKSITHLDVKPENILITETDTPILIDFGGAKEYDEFGYETSQHGNVRTEGYASPEQRDRQSLMNPKSDVFGLAMTLYMLLYNDLPRANKCFSRMIFVSHAKSMGLDNDLNAAIEKVINHAIVKNVEERSTMQEFIGQLEIILKAIEDFNSVLQSIAR